MFSIEDLYSIKKNIFWDEENFEIADFDIFPKILEIYKGCRWKRGYYEITYGAINSNTNMFYTYYSSKESYINLLSSLTYDFHHIMQSKIFAINNLLYPL